MATRSGDRQYGAADILRRPQPVARARHRHRDLYEDARPDRARAWLRGWCRLQLAPPPVEKTAAAGNGLFPRPRRRPGLKPEREKKHPLGPAAVAARARAERRQP